MLLQGLMNRKFPILEYDSTRIAFIEPSKVIAPLDMPEFCVICFFRDAIDKVVTEHNAKVLVTDYWEDGPHHIYEIQYCDQRLAFFHPGGGAPLAAGCAISWCNFRADIIWRGRLELRGMG